MPDEPPEPDEQSRVRLLAAALGDPDLSDDCAHLDTPTQLITTDALVAGVHFDLARDTLEQVGAQAAVANLSDLASSGGASGWLLWSLMLPADFDDEDLVRLARGFGGEARSHGAAVLGGNLSQTPGPLVVSVTAGGPLAGDRAFRRSGARAGDGVYLSGAVGDSALGVTHPDPEARAARHRWRPHLPEAAELAGWGGVTAALDVSDGVLLDAARIAEASDVRLELTRNAIPRGELCRARDMPPDFALTGGEDYVLLFTASEPPPLGVRIGRCATGRGLLLDGEPTRPVGFDHFRRGR